MKADVIIGAGYGDEGKGYFTDYVSSLKNKSVVVRFNGGAQAGHTVVTPEGKKHVFGHFTSNLFLKNASSYLSKYFQINPVIYLKELNQINNLGIVPDIACHSDCYIATPFDMLINQWLEYTRGESRHGSCGLGIGETIHRSEVENVPLYIKDTKNINILKEKLYLVREVFLKRVKELNLEPMLNQYSFVLQQDFIDRFIEDIQQMHNSLKIGVDNINHKFFLEKDIVFEGAQGLMLDQSMGHFPYVTRSNTGLKNVIEFSVENNINELNVIYATRCYKTRHGAGPLKWELKNQPYENIVDNTNIPNEYQGTIRYAYLDLDVLQEAIEKDIKSIEQEITNNNIIVNYKIGMTWLNITPLHYFYHKNKLLFRHTRDFIHYIEEYFDWKIIQSYGKTREDIK